MTTIPRTLTLIAISLLAACAGMSEEQYRAELDRLSGLDCAGLENELASAGSRDAVSLIRKLQGESGCEIKPLIAKDSSASRIRDRNRHFRVMEGRSAVYGRDLRDK
jgi:hypothetical protein